MLANKKASRGEFRELAAEKKGVQSELKTFSIGGKQKKRKRKKTRLVPPRLEPGGADEGSVQRVELPHPGRFSLVLGGVPVLPSSCRVPPEAQVLGIDEGELGTSLVCIGSVLSLAVVPTALQKLHKCMTQNTTELLQDTGGHTKSTDTL
ncbi:hypothetical protein KUCAC02_026918 [Chaenocephalus aceratus]|nr:hypothetical protein KUCAC02_026918 [Chaenocephalus aceratus]